MERLAGFGHRRDDVHDHPLEHHGSLLGGWGVGGDVGLEIRDDHSQPRVWVHRAPLIKAVLEVGRADLGADGDGAGVEEESHLGEDQVGEPGSHEAGPNRLLQVKN